MYNLEERYTIIVDYVKGNLSEEKRRMIEDWINSNELNKDEFKRIEKIVAFSSQLKNIDKINYIDSRKKLQSKIGVSVPNLRLRFLKYAVAIMLPIFFTFLIYNYYTDTFTFNKNIVSSGVKVVMPAKNEISLTLENGKIFNLDNKESIKELKKNKLVKEIDSIKNIGLSYRNIVEEDKLKPVYHKLNIPKGCDYQLILCDGTKVYLNSDTELSFPTAFVGYERRVKLIGEAYFEVVKNKKKPFIVETNNMSVLVTGTAFNVSSYKNEEAYTVLVEGGVEVSSEFGKSNILPGEKITVDKKRKLNNIEEVEVKYYTSWKKGLFYFNDMKLKTLSKKLMRWYDVEFKYDSKDLEELRFSGKIKNNVDLGNILNLISETTNVKFYYKNNIIYVKKKLENATNIL